jgi:UDP-glucose-4-epimerase GalE
MVAEGVHEMVLSSTCAVYGDPQTTPIDEDHPTNPINPYGETKLAVERALGHYGRAYGLRAIALRYFNAAGADPGGELGEDHDPEIHLIPRAIEASRGGAPLQLFGDDYDTADGTCERDYVHVSDLADAHLLALDALATGAATRVYNVGTGRAHSVREVIGAIERVTGCQVPTEAVPRRPGDPAVLHAAADQIGRQLGWRPAHASLDDVVGSAWRWHAAHPHGFGR